MRLDKAPYLEALLASSWMAIANVSPALGVSVTWGPSTSGSIPRWSYGAVPARRGRARMLRLVPSLVNRL